MSNAATILFLCPHNAAKSVIAVADFERLAALHELPFRADSAGTEPDDSISPVVVALLQAEGIDVSGHQPRHVTADELKTAARVISMGCTLDALEVIPAHFEMWTDIPPVSERPAEARAVIQAHVETLVASLSENLSIKNTP